MALYQKIKWFRAWSQARPWGMALLARLLHRVFCLHNHLPGREGLLLVFTGAVGDLVSLTPALRALAHEHPGVPLGLLVKGSGISDILKSCPFLDHLTDFQVHEPTRHKWWEVLKALRRMATRHRYTTAVLTMGTGWACECRIWGLVLLYVTGARRRIAFQEECTPWRSAPRPLRRLPLVTEAIEATQLDRTERFLELFRVAGLLTDVSHTATEVWTSPDDVREVQALNAGLLPRTEKEPVVLVFPSVGSGPGKRWPEGRYVKVINELVAAWKARVFLDGKAQDYPLCRAIAAFSSCCGILAGRHSVGALSVLIARADLVIASDSGPIHIAAATGTPAVSIFGPTDPRIWAPKSAQVTVLRPSECPPCHNAFQCQRGRDFACIKDVQVSDVVHACQGVLARSRYRPVASQEMPAGQPL